MTNIFLLITFVGLLLFVGNIYQYFTTTNKLLLNKKILIANYIFCLLVFICEGLHIFHFYTNNFSYQSVYEYSSLNQELLYKVVGSFSGQSGSFLIWLLILSIIGLIINKKIKEPQFESKFTFLFKALFAIFPTCIALMLFFNSPFSLVDLQLTAEIIDGLGMKETLKSHFNVFHPTLIFISFSLLYVPYILALAALITKQYFKSTDNTKKYWLDVVYSYNKYGLIFLAIGILLGSFWAYYSLGWGGFWGWDPIENAALIPMLLSIILLHSIILHRKSKELFKTCIVLSSIIFPTILLCTFIARSGIAASISSHSYVASSSNGVYAILGLLIIGVLLPLVLFIIRMKNIALNYKPEHFIKYLSSHTTTFLGIVVLSLLVFAVLLGTFAPIIGKIYNDKIILLSNQYFMNWAVPLSTIMLLLLGMTQFLKNGKKTIDASGKEISAFSEFTNKIIFSFSLSIVIMIIAFYMGVKKIEYIFLIFSVAFSMISIIQQYIIKRIRNNKFQFIKLGKLLCHLGINIFIIGAMLYGNFGSEKIIELELNNSVQIKEHELKFIRLEEEETANYVKFTPVIEYSKIVEGKSEYKFNLSPYFLISKTRNDGEINRFIGTELSGISEIYIEPLDYYLNPNNNSELNDIINYPSINNGTILKINFSIKPFIILVWIGGIMIFIGLIISLSPKKK